MTKLLVIKLPKLPFVSRKEYAKAIAAGKALDDVFQRLARAYKELLPLENWANYMGVTQISQECLHNEEGGRGHEYKVEFDFERMQAAFKEMGYDLSVTPVEGTKDFDPTPQPEPAEKPAEKFYPMADEPQPRFYEDDYPVADEERDR